MGNNINNQPVDTDLKKKVAYLEEEIKWNRVWLTKEKEILNREKERLEKEKEEWDEKKENLNDDISKLEAKKDRLIKENAQQEIALNAEKRNLIIELEKEKVDNQMIFIEKTDDLKKKKEIYETEIRRLNKKIANLINEIEIQRTKEEGLKKNLEEQVRRGEKKHG